MSKAARSLFVFGIYSILLGATLMIITFLIFEWLGQAALQGNWIRVAGMLLFALGIYYVLVAKKEMKEFFQWSVYTRSSVIVFFAVFYFLKLLPPIILILGLIDLSGAIWTQVALRRDNIN